jgi:hypothetical protein
MSPLIIAPSKDHFLRNGKPFFYCADTVWSAFTNLSLDDWRYYLQYRTEQGFNALQFNILPQWDRSQGAEEPLPFELEKDGTCDFFKPSKGYFDRAERMVAMTVEHGLLPALTLLWVSYVPGSWYTTKHPDAAMPAEAVGPYLSMVIDRFAKYEPVWIVSGDSNFDPGEAIEPYYTKGLQNVKKRTPHLLATMHVGGEKLTLPKQYIEGDQLDFYMYQSGHNLDKVSTLPADMARYFYNLPQKRPIVNGEPIYEGGPRTAHAIRESLWRSVLSGAKAGVAYGTHGIWSCYKVGMSPRRPVDFRDSMRFEGSWNASYVRWVFETFDLFNIEPINVPGLPNQAGCAAASPDKSKMVFYCPYAAEIKMDLDFSAYRWSSIDLQSRRVGIPWKLTIDGTPALASPAFPSDVLHIGIK